MSRAWVSRLLGPLKLQHNEEKHTFIRRYSIMRFLNIVGKVEVLKASREKKIHVRSTGNKNIVELRKFTYKGWALRIPLSFSATPKATRQRNNALHFWKIVFKLEFHNNNYFQNCKIDLKKWIFQRVFSQEAAELCALLKQGSRTRLRKKGNPKGGISHFSHGREVKKCPGWRERSSWELCSRPREQNLRMGEEDRGYIRHISEGKKKRIGYLCWCLCRNLC